MIQVRRRKRMKILLVDDHVLFREGVALLLQQLVAGDELLQAGACEEALKLLRDDLDVELVLMDIHLPGMSGLDAIPLIRERFPLIPIVALSSSDDRQTILSAIDAGAMGFITKSSSSAVLSAALRLVLSKGIYIPPEILRDRGGLEPVQSPVPQAATSTRTTPADLGLTSRQSDVLFLILQGKSAKAICRDLSLSSSTVKVHTSAALRALNVTTRTQAVIAAAKIGLHFGNRAGVPNSQDDVT
jgi:DNA-binding NarL/FixJ family response regulator